MLRKPNASALANQRHTPQPGARPTIGYLTPRIGDNVGQALWAGVVDAAREGNARLICFAGKVLNDATGASSPANIAYEMANARIVDGLARGADLKAQVRDLLEA